MMKFQKTYLNTLKDFKEGIGVARKVIFIMMNIKKLVFILKKIKLSIKKISLNTQ